MLGGIHEQRPPWLNKNNRRMFQRGLARESYEEFHKKWHTVSGGYPSELTVVLSDVRNIAFLGTSDPKHPDIKLMQLVVKLGRSIGEVENYEARARAEDAAEAYEHFAAMNPTEDMLLAFEAMWLAGEFKAAYAFLAAVRKMPQQP
jgi:hypothetical protein